MSFKYDRIQSRSGGMVEMKYDSDKPETIKFIIGNAIVSSGKTRVFNEDIKKWEHINYWGLGWIA